jgi:hypothetical protein
VHAKPLLIDWPPALFSTFINTIMWHELEGRCHPCKSLKCKPYSSSGMLTNTVTIAIVELKSFASCLHALHVLLTDCENGLATNSRISSTQSWCFSAELLQECKRLQDAVTPYSLNISSLLQTAIISDPESVALGAVRSGDALTNVTKVFVAAVKRRGDISTANIRCASYESTKEDFSGASVLAAGWQAAVALLTLTIMYFVC